MDVSDREAVRKAALTTRTQMGEVGEPFLIIFGLKENIFLQVTLLFNNAGIMPCKPLLAHSEKEIEKVAKLEKRK